MSHQVLAIPTQENTPRWETNIEVWFNLESKSKVRDFGPPSFSNPDPDVNPKVP